jgi:hypothetical protein
MKTSRRCRNTSPAMYSSEKYVEMFRQSRSRMRTILLEAVRPSSAIKIFICIVSLSALIIFLFIYAYAFKFRNRSQVISLFLNTPPSGFPWDLVQRHLQRRERQTETQQRNLFKYYQLLFHLYELSSFLQLSFLPLWGKISHTHLTRIPPNLITLSTVKNGTFCRTDADTICLHRQGAEILLVTWYSSWIANLSLKFWYLQLCLNSGSVSGRHA